MYHQLLNFALLAVLSVSYAAAVFRVEHLRLAVTVNGDVPNVHNMWVMAAVLTLRPWMVLLLVVFVFGAEWPVRQLVVCGDACPPRKRLLALGKHAYSGAALAASAILGEFVMYEISGLAGVLLGVAAYLIADIALMAAAIAISGHPEYLKMFLVPRNHVLEISTATLGLAVALGIRNHSALAFLAVPVLIVVQRKALGDVVRAVRAYDPVTGIWNRRGWRVQAGYMLADARPAFLALLLIEPEAGVAPASVATSLGPWVRRTDLIGRYVADQIVVMIKAGPASGAELCARGVRQSLAEAGLSCSIGYAVATTGTTLESMLVSAMSEMVIDAALRSAGRL